MIDIRRLKKFATGSLPCNSQLRAVLLTEGDQLTPKDFMAKIDVWIKLLNIEKADLQI